MTSAEASAFLIWSFAPFAAVFAVYLSRKMTGAQTALAGAVGFTLIALVICT